METEWKAGDTATCSQCGRQIVYVGPYWEHPGDIKPRHPALPRLSDSTAPLQPNWHEQFDAREQAQIALAREYAANFSHAGAPGHGQFLIIAKLANLLDGRAARDRGTPNG